MSYCFHFAIHCNIGTIRTNLTWTKNVECTNVERKIDPHCNTHKLSYLLQELVLPNSITDWPTPYRWVTLSTSISYRCHCCDVMSWLRALVLVKRTRPGGRRGPHALYLIGTSASLMIVYSSVKIWQPRVWCCCCCCGDEKYTTNNGCLVNSPVSSHLWGIWNVKTTDELCTRTFAVHTLKSPPTKMSKFPDRGQTLPDGGL